jgi:hypothetical protein
LNAAATCSKIQCPYALFTMLRGSEWKVFPSVAA